MGFFEKLGFGLKKTRKASFESIAELMDSPKITEELYEELTERLILADTGADVAEELVDELRELVKKNKLKTGAEALEQLKGQVENAHVYYWRDGKRYPLADGAEEWRHYLQKAADTGISGYATLEFVKDDSTEQFMEDSRTLRELLSRLR